MFLMFADVDFLWKSTLCQLSIRPVLLVPNAAE